MVDLLFTYEGFNILKLDTERSTNAEKSAIGLVEVTISGNQKDSEYYDNTLSGNKVESDGSVTRTWSILQNTFRFTDNKNSSAKENAKSQLNPTDWYVVRKSELELFSDEISAYRTVS